MITDYRKHELRVPGVLWEIPATLCLPEGEGRFPWVMMMHGTGSCRDEVGGGYARLAPMLAQRGIASVRFDFAGCGESPVDFSAYTLTSAMRDGKTVAAYMKAQPFIAPERFGIMGWSQGAMLAIMLAGKDIGARSMVTWAAALKMDFYWKEYREKAYRDGYVIIDPEWRPPLKVSRQWFEEAAVTDAADDLEGYSGDVLAICGSEDQFDFQNNLPTIVERSSGRRREQWVVENADHVFNIDSGDDRIFTRVAERTAEWFVQTL